jgi:tRNA nucleotidyltransferase/poly(A) polymerase
MALFDNIPNNIKIVDDTIYGEIDDIMGYLSRFGTVELEYTGGYQGFEVTSDHNLPIEKDLERRDFTINSIAKDAEGNIVDPYGGLIDLQNKVIRVTNPIAFSEDPLRMLRAVQFAARFDFKIEPKTLQLIKENAPKIKEISAERILIEFEKIVHKGDPVVGIYWLDKTLLFSNIFDIPFNGKYSDFQDVANIAEFIYCCLKNTDIIISEFFKNKIRGSIEGTKNVESLEYIRKLTDNIVHNRAIASIMYNKYPDIVNSELLPNALKDIFNSFRAEQYPSGINKLDITGNDIMQLGLKGKQVGDALKLALLSIYSNKLKNSKNDILKFVENLKLP